MELKQRKIFRKIAAVSLVIALVFGSGTSAFAWYKDVSVSAPSEVTVEKGKTNTLKISFKGVGIAYAKGYVTSGISARFTNVTWKAYPANCTATLSYKASKEGTITFVLGNKDDGEFKKVPIRVKLKKAEANSQKYIVSHVKGVNLRSKPSTGGKVLTAIPYKAKLTVTQRSGDWGKVSYKGKTGWVCLDYCEKDTGTDDNSQDKNSVPASVRVSQMNSRSCTSAAVTTMVRAMYYTKGKDYKSVTESKVRKAGWTNAGLKNSFNFNGLKIRAKYISGSSVSKESQLKKLLESHPEGVVIYGWNSSRSHAVYLGKNFKVLDPAVNASKNYITISQSFIPGSGLSTVQKVWYIEK